MNLHDVNVNSLSPQAQSLIKWYQDGLFPNHVVRFTMSVSDPGEIIDEPIKEIPLAYKKAFDELLQRGIISSYTATLSSDKREFDIHFIC